MSLGNSTNPLNYATPNAITSFGCAFLMDSICFSPYLWYATRGSLCVYPMNRYTGVVLALLPEPTTEFHVVITARTLSDVFVVRIFKPDGSHSTLESWKWNHERKPTRTYSWGCVRRVGTRLDYDYKIDTRDQTLPYARSHWGGKTSAPMYLSIHANRALIECDINPKSKILSGWLKGRSRQMISWSRFDC